MMIGERFVVLKWNPCRVVAVCFLASVTGCSFLQMVRVGVDYIMNGRVGRRRNFEQFYVFFTF